MQNADFRESDLAYSCNHYACAEKTTPAVRSFEKMLSMGISRAHFCFCVICIRTHISATIDTVPPCYFVMLLRAWSFKRILSTEARSRRVLRVAKVHIDDWYLYIDYSQLQLLCYGSNHVKKRGKVHSLRVRFSSHLLHINDHK